MDVQIGEQFALFVRMHQLVVEGRLTFPRQVTAEVAQWRHPDTPGTWCAEVSKHVNHRDPSDDTMPRIAHAIADLVERDAEHNREPADPYIVAMAYELVTGDDPRDVVVATTDCVDRLPVKVALTTACGRLGIPSWGLSAFLRWVRAGMVGI